MGIRTGPGIAGQVDTLYSEDMQHGQVFDERLTVVNPFKEAAIGSGAPAPKN